MQRGKTRASDVCCATLGGHSLGRYLHTAKQMCLLGFRAIYETMLVLCGINSPSRAQLPFALVEPSLDFAFKKPSLQKRIHKLLVT